MLTEDSVAHLGQVPKPLRVWISGRIILSCMRGRFVSQEEDLELVQLNSFGCGLDAVTTDQVQEILHARSKIYTCLKIDEISNLGAARIRLRSLKAAILERKRQGRKPTGEDYRYIRKLFTKPMKESHTIIVPQMAPIHFQLLQEAFRLSGYNMVVCPAMDKEAVDVGLQYVNNDACYPAIIVVLS